MSEAVQKRVATCICVAVCVMVICAAVVGGIRAKNEPADACKCEGCKCDAKWQVQGQINVKVIDHLQRNGVNIGDPAPVGSAK